MPSLIIAILICMTFVVNVFAMDNIATIESASMSSVQLQEKESIALAKYNLLLREWAYSSDFISDYYADFPDFYGGAYINDEKELVIQITNSLSEAREYFSEIIDLSGVVFENVVYSFSEIKDARNQIEAKIPLNETSKSSGIVGTGISFRKNSVNIYIDNENVKESTVYNTYSVVNEIEGFTNIEIVDIKDIPTSTEVVVQETTEIEANNLTEVSILEPGSELLAVKTNLVSLPPRSMGYWVYDSEDNLGIITTPHDAIDEGDYIYYDNKCVGNAGTPYYSGTVDAVFVPCTHPDIRPSRAVSGWDFTLNSVTSILLAEGASVYGKGKQTGCILGTVEDISCTAASGIRDCVLTSCVATFGDSGGIMAGGGTSATRYIAGIMNAITEFGSNALYVKAINIHNTLGVSIY